VDLTPAIRPRPPLEPPTRRERGERGGADGDFGHVAATNTRLPAGQGRSSFETRACSSPSDVHHLADARFRLIDGTINSSSATKGYFTLGTGPHGGVISVFVGDENNNDGALTTQVAYNPPVPLRWQDLAVGESATVPISFTATDLTTDPPTSQSGSYNVTETFVSRETLTVPAGTYSTCKFTQSLSVAPNRANTTWVVAGYGFEVRSIVTDTSTGTVVDETQATSVTVNGAPRWADAPSVERVQTHRRTRGVGVENMKRRGPSWLVLGPLLKQLLRQNHGIDHVDHAIAGLDVRLHDGCTVDLDRPSVDVKLERLSIDGFYFGSVLHFEHVCGHDLAGNHMVEKNCFELLGVGEECVERGFWHLGEGFVGGGKHSEGTRTLQRVH
jgi:hypothetical protein